MSEPVTDVAIIKDHAYQAPEGKPWGLCVHCKLAEAAHLHVATPYKPGKRT